MRGSTLSFQAQRHHRITLFILRQTGSITRSDTYPGLQPRRWETHRDTGKPRDLLLPTPPGMRVCTVAMQCASLGGNTSASLPDAQPSRVQSLQKNASWQTSPAITPVLCCHPSPMYRRLMDSLYLSKDTMKHSAPPLRAVALADVPSQDLDRLWHYEAQWWQETFLWGIASPLAALRRVVERRGVPGQAVYAGSQAGGYAYYMVTGTLGILSGLVVLPEWRTQAVGETLLQATLGALHKHNLTRLESPCMSMASAPMVPIFEQAGFRTYWREFLRVELRHALRPTPHPSPGQLVPWHTNAMSDDANIMASAYAETVDVDLNRLYHTTAGCQTILDDLVSQGGCGRLVPEASARMYVHGEAAGFILVTEISPRQGHLAQIAVAPAHQKQGLGQALLGYCLSQLATLQFHTLSLIVSQANTRALYMYKAVGMQPVLSFPVFVWEQ